MKPEDHPFLKECPPWGIHFGLKTMKTVLKALGNPHHYFKTIHIAGTNGKGSTARMLSVCLEACGYKTGLYTSPHIQSIRERFQINNILISSSALCEQLSQVEKICVTLKKKKGFHPPTYFEICTLAAFLWFKEQKVEIAVIEVGMGGRLDATNVLHSPYVVIPSIGRDHLRYLGNTLSKIALEKAAILHGRPSVVLGTLSPALWKTISSAHPMARYYRVKKDFETERTSETGKLLYHSGGDFNALEYELSLPGIFQHLNSSLVLKILECMKKDGFFLSEEKIIKAFKKVYWPGRFELIRKKPPVLLDVAHNVPAIKILLSSMAEEFPGEAFHCICGFCSDKEYLPMLALLSRACKSITLIPFTSERNVSPQDILKQIKKPLACRVSTASGFREAFEKNKNKALLICGSFYVIESGCKVILERRGGNKLFHIKRRTQAVKRIRQRRGERGFS